MEFQKSTVPCLKLASHQSQTQELSGEITLSPDEPEAAQILGIWGTPFIKDRERRDKSVETLGECLVQILYAPAEGGLPKAVSCTVPFRFKLDRAQEECQIRMQAQLSALEARVQHGRKLLIRGSLLALSESFVPGDLPVYAPVDPPKDLEILKKKVSAILPAAIRECNFLLDEELELPGGAPACGAIVSYQLQPRISERKVLGEKAVFRGSCGVHMVYMTTEDRLAVWDFDVPFSQYAEFSESYEESAQLQIEFLLNQGTLQLESPGKTVSLRCSVTALCTILAERNMDVVTDLYAPRRKVSCQLEKLPISESEKREWTAYLEARFPIRGNPIDCTILTGLPLTERSDGSVKVTQKGQCSVLYYDEGGTLTCQTAPCVMETETSAGVDASLGLDIKPLGPVQWTVGGGNLTVRESCLVSLTEHYEQKLQAISGADLSDILPASPGKPSLIIRRFDGNTTLWNLAKSAGSTISEIQKANALTGQPESGQLLVIPVL